jgi:hypothetical protein
MADEGGGREPQQRLEAALTAARSESAGPADGKRPHAAYAGPVTEDEVTEWLATGSEPERASWLGAGLAALIVIPALVIGSLAVVVVRHLTGTNSHSAAPARLEAPARQQAAVRDEAATWIARQVSPGATVSCDRVMCAALQARGLPGRGLLVLGPLSPDPRDSSIVVETAAVRTLFGTSLDQAWAPAVLVSFGSGSAGITVRVVASHGAVAYQTALAGERITGKAAGARLLADRRISVPASARAPLTAGLVDLRLLSALTALSSRVPVRLVDFGNAGTGASAGIPFRFADLSQAGPRPGLTRTAYVRSVRAYLAGLKTTVRPARTVPMVLPDGQAVLRVEFTAPSPLTVPGDQGSP